MSKKNRKTSRVYLGDFILTSKTFEPEIKGGIKIDMKDSRVKGIVICKSNIPDVYGVRIGPGFNFTHHLDGILSESEGCWIHKKDFDLLRELKR